MRTPDDARSVNIKVSWWRRFWLFIGLGSFLCALGIFTESPFYAYTIGIHGTYAHIIYYVVGGILSSAVLVLLIQPDCCKAFLDKCKQCFIFKSFGCYLVMLTICFLSSGTGLPYLGLYSDGTAPNPAAAVAVAPYRSQAFSEIAGFLASALLTVNAFSIIILLRPAAAFFEVAAALTMKSAMALLYKYPYVTIGTALFILTMTLLKDFLCRDQVVKADDKAAGKPSGDGKAAGGEAAGKRPGGGGKAAGGEAAGKRPGGGGKAAGGEAAGKRPGGNGKAAGGEAAARKRAPV